MKKSNLVCTVLFTTSAMFSVSAMAQSPTCDDVVWNAAVLERTPTMADHCLEVVQRDGAWYAKTTAKVVRQGVNSTVVRYLNRDGSWGESERAYPPRGFTANIAGQDVKIADLAAGQEVNVYVMDHENFDIPMLASASAAPMAAADPEPEPEPEPAYEPAPAALPSTAGQANWLAVMGSLLMLMAAAVHVGRNRT